jgi:hypothetical protein
MTFTLGQLIFWIVVSAFAGLFVGANVGIVLMCALNLGQRTDETQRSLRKEIEQWDPFSPPVS